MKRNVLFGKLLLLSSFILAFQSCKKENGIDNNNAISRPYALYAASANGEICVTNDGDNYKTVLPGDGVPVRAMATSGSNLLIVKGKTVYVSTNNGRNFNPISTTTQASVPTSILWQYFILDVPSHDRRVYVSSSLFLGGTAKAWANGESFTADTLFEKTAVKPYSVESFTQLTNNVVLSYSISKPQLYMRLHADSPWLERPATNLPVVFAFYLTHNGNTVIATDYNGVKGAWYSTDTGKTFKQYTGLPNKKLYTTHAPFNETVLVGTDSNGVYRLATTNFVQSNTGMAQNTSVYSIVSKDNVYKNGVSKKYVYAATNTGIYYSQDLGLNWVKVKDGDYRLVR